MLSERKNLDTIHQKYCAIVQAILLVRPYSEVARFTLRTECHTLRWIPILVDVTGKLARWMRQLMKFDFKIVHTAGIKHHAADAFSRFPTNGSDRTVLEDDIPIMVVTPTNMKALNF